MASDLPQCDWKAPDIQRQIKDNDINISLKSKTRSKKEQQKLQSIEENMNKMHKSLLYDSTIWSKLHENKELPHSNDWLWNREKDQFGQSFRDWFKLTKRFPNNSQNIIGLAPIGDFNIFYDINNNKIPLMHLLSELVCIFFGIQVKLLPSIPVIENTKNDSEKQSYVAKRASNIKNGIINTRMSKANDIKQLQTEPIFDILQDTKHKKHKLFVIMGATMFDLYPNENYNFVYGQARINDGVGVFSFSRYIKGFYDLSPTRFDAKLKEKKKKSRWPQVSEPKLSKKAIKRRQRLKYLRTLLNGDNGDDMNEKDMDKTIFETRKDKIGFLRSCAKVLTHEICHLFGIKHCIYFQCRMNGANHQDEFNSQPFYICPICLHKLYIARELQMKYDKMKEMSDEDNDEIKEDVIGDDKLSVLKRRMDKRRKGNGGNVKQFNLVERYKQLQEWCAKTGLIEEANWYRQRLRMCESVSRLDVARAVDVTT